MFYRVCIWPLIKFNWKKVIPGAYWKKAVDMRDALRKWDVAVKAGQAERLV